MLLQIDFSSDIPIYLQIRNQIVMGIAEGKLQAGEKLPTIRSLADESGVNMMTVNKAYQVLKQEGYITTDRRNGASISESQTSDQRLSQKSMENLKLIISEAHLSGISKKSMLELCNRIYDDLEV